MHFISCVTCVTYTYIYVCLCVIHWGTVHCQCASRGLVSYYLVLCVYYVLYTGEQSTGNTPVEGL